MNNGIFKCPYTHRTNDQSLWCEAGRINFHDMASRNAYLNIFCKEDWESCTLAMFVTEYLERNTK